MRYSTSIDVLFEHEALSERYEQVVRAVYTAQLQWEVFKAPECPHVKVDVQRWMEIEATTHHETAAWVQAWREQLPPEVVPYTYLGMTSSNLQDCAFALLADDLVRHYDFVVTKITDELSRLTGQLAGKLRSGRTHGQLAYPVWRSDVYARTSQELDMAIAHINRGKPYGALGGPTGNPLRDVLGHRTVQTAAEYLNIDLDLYPTQVASRLQLNRFAQEIYNLGAVVEQLAVYHRLESLSGIERFRERFDPATDKGSSSMPYKVNPRRSERVCGLARVNRGHLMAIAETCSTLWWERDLSNSSVERTALRDLITTTSFMLQETLDILRTSTVSGGVEVMPDYVWDHKRLVGAQLQGEDPETTYRQLQARRLEEPRAQD